MAKERIAIVLVAGILLGIFTVQSLSQSANQNRSAGPPDLERLKSAEGKIDKIKKEFLKEKAAIKPSEQQWEIIKPKFERIQRLRQQAYSGAGLSMTYSSTSSSRSSSNADNSRPKAIWTRNWDKKAPSERTEGERLVDEIIALMESYNPKPEQFEEKMNALRKSKEKPREELAKAIQELRKELTVRQEAALVLMGWL